jgi:hypothetical protein
VPDEPGVADVIAEQRELLERRLRMDSSDSGTPPSREPIGAKE